MQTNTNTDKLLSKWWQTDSCREAFERAANVKREKLNKFLADHTAKLAQIKYNCENWELVS